MRDPRSLQTYEISEEDIRHTPPSVLHLLAAYREEITLLRKRVEELEARLHKNSSNSHQPPSSDQPFQKKASKEEKGKPGGAKGHTGHRQVLLDPTEAKALTPELCSFCGNPEFPETTPYYTHQVIELPEITLEVTHFILHKGPCPCCGTMNKALVPQEHRTGYGPRLSAVIAEMAGTQGDSRTTIQNFCASVLGFHISVGTIQKVIDRVSYALDPHYEEIAAQARTAEVNHVDETSWRHNGGLSWLWVMASSTVALFLVHSKRSKAAFESLIKDWTGILISDGYSVYRTWVGLRQTCLAHLIREARALSERKNPDVARFGKWATAELKRLCHMANAPPPVGEWRAFYARFIHLIARNHERQDEAGKFARRLRREMDALWVFLAKQGVSPTNNHAERMLRYAVLWRKRSQGTTSDKGDRWVERILTLRQTCRLRSKPTFPILVDAIRSSFKREQPDLSLIAQGKPTTPL